MNWSKYGTGGKIRNPDRLNRSQVLYLSELQAKSEFLLYGVPFRENVLSGQMCAIDTAAVADETQLALTRSFGDGSHTLIRSRPSHLHLDGNLDLCVSE